MEAETLKTFDELAQFADEKSIADVGKTINAYEASQYWEEVRRWARDCGKGGLTPDMALAMELQSLQKLLWFAEGQPDRNINAGHIVARAHRIELCGTLCKNSGISIPILAGIVIERLLKRAKVYKPHV